MNALTSKSSCLYYALGRSLWNTQVSSFSVGCQILSAKKYRRRWLTPEKWPKNNVDDGPWAPNVPMERNENLWTRKNAYFGTYDFMDILGKDVTLQPKLLCDGPEYIRGKKLNELQMLLRRRRKFGPMMHIQDLDSANKRIRYLLKVYNRVRRRTHG